MKLLKTFAIVSAVALIAACSTTKKTSSPGTGKAAATSGTTVKSATGVYAPGTEELAAIRTKYSDVSMAVLTEGYTIYTGVCTKCHNAKNIYKHPEASWKGIIDEMAQKAKITAAQTDAVYKYVLAIKATQPAATKTMQDNPYNLERSR